MSEIFYEIYYQDGLKENVDEAQAVAQLATLLKLTQEDAGKIIRATNRVIKAGLTREQAEKYLFALDRLGMKVQIREVQPAEVSAISASEVDAAETADSTFAPQPVSGNSKDIQVEFTGKGMEYFKIWIVNIFLTILTLGIYSAWAKVRNKQYFYGNTIIDGSSFQYTASPIAILKGRLIAVAAFIVYSLITGLLPIIGILLMLAFIAIIPWLIVRSLAFNARNSVYRNIRFNFTGKAMDAFKVFILWPLLIIFTLGFIAPLVWHKQQRFFVTHTRYGTSGFEFFAETGQYYRIFFIMLGGILGFGILLSVLAGLLSAISPIVGMIVMTPLAAAGYILLFAYIAVSLSNLFFNSTQIAGNRFTSRLEIPKMVWLYFTNVVAILFSLGLMIPWVQVRMARYRAECLSMQVETSLDNFIGEEQKNVSALGEEMSEVFDVEVSFI